jgi:hypothetical protein
MVSFCLHLSYFDADKLELDVCGVLLIANITRIFFWLGNRFETRMFPYHIMQTYNLTPFSPPHPITPPHPLPAPPPLYMPTLRAELDLELRPAQPRFRAFPFHPSFARPAGVRAGIPHLSAGRGWSRGEERVETAGRLLAVGGLRELSRVSGGDDCGAGCSTAHPGTVDMVSRSGGMGRWFGLS